MSCLINLQEFADKRNIEINDVKMNELQSISLPIGNGYIAMEQSLSNAEYITHLAHELGHIETGGFYKVNSKYQIKAKAEHKANAWAFKKLIPIKELKKAVQNGQKEIWQLAEKFEVTEEFMLNAVLYYKVKELI